MNGFDRIPQSPFEPDQITLNGSELGTGHGLAKLPYIRDTRRSIGLDGFVLKFEDISGPASQKTGTKFPDRIALGAYAADIHPLVSCSYPAHTKVAHDTLPFYLPFRALTHYRFTNLLVAGKTMAQSFLVNSATRLASHRMVHWHSGRSRGRLYGRNRNNPLDRSLKRLTSCNKESKSSHPSIGLSPLIDFINWLFVWLHAKIGMAISHI